MLAAVLRGVNQLDLEQVPIPEPGSDEVVVRIVSCGICATDYKAIRGIRRNVRFPFIPGHEPSGVVARVGQGVRHFHEGDDVICQPSGYCGFCESCRVGNTHYCPHAFCTGGDGPDEVWPGAFAEYMLTREICLFAKPAAVDYDAACLTEPLSGVWKGLIQHSETQLGDDVVIIGVGSIGQLCVLLAKAAGAGRLIAVDTSEYARHRALSLGASHALDPIREDVKKRVYEITQCGPDLVVEAAGSIEAVELMLDLRRHGTKLNLFGITTHETFELDGGLTHFLEGRLDASFGTTPLAMRAAIRLLERGLIDTSEVISHRFPLTRIHDALDALEMLERSKVIINP